MKPKKLSSPFFSLPNHTKTFRYDLKWASVELSFEAGHCELAIQHIGCWFYSQPIENLLLIEIYKTTIAAGQLSQEIQLSFAQLLKQILCLFKYRLLELYCLFSRFYYMFVDKMSVFKENTAFSLSRRSFIKISKFST